MKTAILPFLCLLFGTAAGWFSAADSPAAPTAAEPRRLSSRQAREASRSHAMAVPADVAARLAPIHAARNPQERLRAVIHLARTLPVSELPRWFDAPWLKLQDGGDLNVFYEITRNRWLAEDPAGIVERALSKQWPNLDTLAHRWATADPDAALAHLQSKNPAERQRLQQSMMSALAVSRPAEVLALLHGLVNPSQGTYQWTATLRALARHHPGLLESAPLPAALRMPARAMLVRTRLERDFSGELARLAASPTGFGDFQNLLLDYSAADKFSKEILAHIDQLPAAWLNTLVSQSGALIGENAEAWLNLDLQALGMTEDNAGKFRDAAWRMLAQSNPAKVLDRFSDVDPVDEIGRSFLTIALRTLHQTSPEKATQWLAQYESRTGDDAFKQQLQRSIAPDDPPARATSAQSLIETFQSANPDDSAQSDLTYQFRNAPQEVQTEFARTLTSMEPEAVAQIGYALGTGSLNNFPTAVQASMLASMIGHPPADVTENLQTDLLRTTSMLATRWVRDDAAAASRWVARLPAGEARQWALRNVAATWTLYDPVSTSAWLNQLPAPDRNDVRQFLEKP